jgi:peptide/nickel transport system substrate-binding protein
MTGSGNKRTGDPGRIHPAVLEGQFQLQQGRISRREFLRLATLLGLGLPAANVLAACGTPATSAPATAGPTAVPATAVPSVKRGGTLRVAMQLQAVDHPVRFSWVEAPNSLRHVFEYLTETDNKNITHPYLLESWTASDDLKTWTLNLRKGVQWFKDGSNVEEFVADHVKWNFDQWLTVDQSAVAGLWSGFLTPAGVEVLNPSTVVLHLDQPQLAVPEILFHYPAMVLHPSFNGDISTGQNASTGPYTLAEYKPKERARLVRREGYWQNGIDGEPLPYLDAIEFIDLGNNQTAAVNALKSGQVDNIYQLTPDNFLALKNDSAVKIEGVGSAKAKVLRVRVDQAPWDNNDVRTALKICQDRDKILASAMFGEGLIGHDCHVSPVHPEFAPIDVPKYDPDRAKTLLAGAGLTSLDVNVAVGTGWTDIVAYMESLKETAAPAGINIIIDAMPNDNYWGIWEETTVGVTPWTSRPLGVMILPLGYGSDADGKPLSGWNESRWVDQEFSELVVQASGTLDLEARRAIMKKIETIQQERGSIGISYWEAVWEVFNPAFQAITAHPTSYNLWREVWYDPDQEKLRQS